MRNLRTAVLACCAVLLPASLLADGPPPDPVAELRETATALELWPKLGDGGLREAAYRGG